MFLANMFKSKPISANSKGTFQWLSSVSNKASSAGMLVNRDTAFAQSAVQACVTLLAESVAQLPCELYRRSKDGKRERATDHPLYDVIHSQPNKKDTIFEYNEQKQGFLGVHGNSYSLIERDGSGYVTELIPVNPNKIQVLKGTDGLPYYNLTEQNEILPMRMVHHVKAFSFDGFLGVSPLQTNTDVIGLSMAVDQHAAQVFSNGTTMSGVIERPLEAKAIDSQEKVDAILNKWREKHSGVRNAFSVALLQEGMTYKQLAMDNERAQLLESRQYGVVEICRLYKVPPHMIQSLDKATFSNIEHQGLQFVIYTLLPWLKRHEAAMMRDLLLKSERKDLYIEFNVSGLLRGDQKARYESYAIGRQWGWLSVNDIRRMENLAPITGGDTYLTPLNMIDSSVIQGADQPTKEQLKDIETICEK